MTLEARSLEIASTRRISSVGPWRCSRRTSTEVDLTTRMGSQPEAWRIHRVCEYVEANVDQPIRIEILSAMVRLSATHFSRAFKLSMGETPHSYIVRRRLEKARYLMLTTESSLSEIALASGFADQSHLTRTFRRCTKVSPGARRCRSASPPETDCEGGSRPAESDKDLYPDSLRGRKNRLRGCEKSICLGS